MGCFLAQAGGKVDAPGRGRLADIIPACLHFVTLRRQVMHRLRLCSLFFRTQPLSCGMNNDMPKEIDVVAAIIRREGRILAVRRPEGKPMAGYWEFPGGKVESGEGLAQALRRELGEELGVDPDVLTLEAFDLWREKRHIYEHMTVRLHFFLVDGYEGPLKPQEGQDMVWVRPEEAVGLDFLPADRAIVELLVRPDTKRLDAGRLDR